MEENRELPPEPSLLFMPWRWSASDWIVFGACLTLFSVVATIIAGLGRLWLFEHQLLS